MKLFINSKITIVEPKKNKHYGYYTLLEKSDPSVLKIKSKSASGRQRGTVGEIYRDGKINVNDNRVLKFITPDLKKRINFAVDILLTMKGNMTVSKGLVNFQRQQVNENSTAMG